MARIHKAYTRLTHWLQSKGHLCSMAAPAPRPTIMKTLEREFRPLVDEARAGGARSHDEIILSICDGLGIGTVGRASPEMRELGRQERARKRQRYLQTMAPVTPEQQHNSTRKVSPVVAPNTDEFLRSYEWRRVRLTVLKRDGRKCRCCGATPESGAVMHVDHIKPRKFFPELALDQTNLQVLCEECNHGKGNWDMTDWRAEAAAGPLVKPK